MNNQLFDLMFNSSLHPSGLQTKQLNREPNPLQRHMSNKKVLEVFYQDIGNNISYEGKLQKLGDLNFINHYKKTKYWNACKFISNEKGNQEFQLTKVKVSNRFFHQIMTDGKEIEFDLRSATFVVVQPKSHFEMVTNTLKVCSDIQTEYQAEKNESYLQEIKSIHKNNSGSFGIFVRWHFESALSRIIVLVKDKIDKDKMLFIYNRESDENEPMKESKLALTYFQNDDPDTTYMKELIKVHLCKQKNEGILSKFKSVFSQNIKDDFKRKIDDVLQTEKIKDNKFTGNVKLIHAFKNFDRFQSEDMLNRWKNKAGQKAKEKNLMVEVAEIWVKNVTSMKSVNLQLKNYRKEGREEEHRKRYVFKKIDGEYSIYQPAPQEEVKCCLFQLPRGVLCKEIVINVDAHDSNIQRMFLCNYTYYKSEGVDAFSHIINLLDSNKVERQGDRNCFVVLKTKETRNTALKSVELHHQRALFDQVGRIPTKYRSSLEIDYNPTTFPTIRKLVAPEIPQKLSKATYQQCYFSLVKFIQSEENKSQLLLSGLALDRIVDKCPMNERLAFYQKEILKAIGDINVSKAMKGSPVIYESRKMTSPEENKLIAYLSVLDHMMLSDLSGREFKVSHIQYKNLQEDIAQYKPLNQVLVNQLLVKYLHFINRVPKIKEFGYSLTYSSNLIPILQKYILIFFNSKQASQEDVNNQTKQVIHFFVFVCFLARVYSYSDSINLKNELYILRHLVLNNLPYYNDFLSRVNIGLQNLIAPHLLNLFTDLSEELTFRIWDFLISSDNVLRARVAVAFTLLVYMETTRNLPIIPINQFMEKVSQNYKKLHIEIDLAVQMEKGTELYFAGERSKEKKLQKLVNGKEKTIVSDKYLQRIILGDTFSNLEKQKKVQAHYQNNPTVQPIQDISYPLPRPNYFGHPITEIVIFVHNLNILQNLNLMSEKYALRISTPAAKSNRTIEIPIISKNNFYNQSFKIPLNLLPEDKAEKEQNVVFVEIVRKGLESVELVGKLNYSHYHKDKAYKAIVVLHSKAKHNKGETVLNLSFCLKSSQYNKKLEERNLAALETLSDQVLDYDIGDTNEVMRSLRDLHQTFEQIKNPLDQFSTEQNKRLKNCALNFFDYAWLQSSKTTVQDIKTIFYHIFPQQKDQDLKLQFSKIYEIFSEEHKMQHIYLAQVLTRLVLSQNITKKKKLTYLYCLGVHYQNTYTKKITSETINSMIRVILKQKGIVSACPYEIETCGKILEASYFGSSLKSQEQKIDFTEILQDWAYMCTFKFEFNSVILGTANNLSILRSLFDDSTIRRMEGQTECRFQIVYQIDGEKYLWSVVVDPKTFIILKRGTKFLNTFDGYSEIKYLDSTQEYLYNCQNIIPLQSHKTYNYAEFTQVMFENELVRYALQMPSTLIKEPTVFEQVRPRDPIDDSRASSVYSNPQQRDRLDKRVIDHSEQETYDSWALHRGQNCLQSWRKCCIVGPGSVLSEIKYLDDPQTYSASTLDLISMDEINLNVNLSKNQFA